MSSGVAQEVGRSDCRSVTPGDNYGKQLEYAQALVEYAAEIGVPVDGAVRAQVLAAQAATSGGWTDKIALDLLHALTILSDKLRPVTGASLSKCVEKNEAARAIRTYRWVAISLAVVILPYSCAAFVATGTCEAIRKDIESANGLAVMLNKLSYSTPSSELDSEQVRELQAFAATIRDTHTRARRLRLFAGEADLPVPTADLELPVPITSSNIAAAVRQKIEVYQHVRAFAQSVREAVSMTFGAVTTCVLPLLYALLGACAYLIRRLEDQRRARTFNGTDSW